MRKRIALELLKIARLVLGTAAEKQVEQLFKVLLKGTPFANKAFAVGGYVRDEALGLESKDLDIVVEMRGGAKKLTHFIHEMFPNDVSRPRQMGAAYPIWQITFKDNVDYKGKTYRTKGAVIEFADTQREMFPDPESRQRETEFGTLEQDVERRDFTVNMLMKDLTTGEVKDLTGVSVNDIRKGILRGHPGVDFNKILRDDPLRMLRLIRFQAKYGWDIPLSVLKIVKANAKRIEIVSAERIQEELVKIMKLGKLGQAVKMMKAVGLLGYVFPEIQKLKETPQDPSKGYHLEGDVFNHTMLVLKSAKPGVENQLAALLHDVGKPASQQIIGDRIKFHGHEEVGEDIAEAILRRLKFDRKTIDTVKKMVRNHMRPHALSRDEKITQKALRKFIRRVGDEMVDSILDLAEADALGNLPPRNHIPELRDAIDKIRTSPMPVKAKPVLDGNEIMRTLGIKPGPMIGEAVQFLQDAEDEYASLGKELTKEEAKRLLLTQFGE